MEEVAAKGICFPKSPHKIIARVLPVVVVKSTITGALVGIKAQGFEVQATIWAFVTIHNPHCTMRFRQWRIGIRVFGAFALIL